MSVLPAQTIRKLCVDPETAMIWPFSERALANGMTGGLGPCTYDFRIKQKLVLLPWWKLPCLLVLRAFDWTWNRFRRTPMWLYAHYHCSFALASTVERVNIPHDICGTVMDKSSWARQGLAVQNTKFDPGFHGYPTIELSNHGLSTLVIEAGQPICQFKFERLEEPTDLPYAGRYLGQGDEPTPYRPAKDKWG